MTRVFVAVAAAIAAASSVPIVRADQDQQAFRGSIHTVSIYASVLDREGRLVTNLDRDDFEVYDDGRRQELTVFANGRPADHHRHHARPQRQRLAALHAGARRGRGVRPASERHGPRAHRQLQQPRCRSIRRSSPRQRRADRILSEELPGTGPTPLWNAAAVAMQALEQEPGRRVVLMFTDGYDNPDARSEHDVPRSP